MKSQRRLANSVNYLIGSKPIRCSKGRQRWIDFQFTQALGDEAIVLFTDGENTWGKATMKSTLREAEESDIIIYTLQYGDLPTQKYLQQLADKTGGRYFKGGDMNVIRQSFAAVAEELRRQYLIGYYPKEPAQWRQERKIKVKVNRERVAVRTRTSYTYVR